MGSVKIWRPSYSISLQLIMKYIMIFQAFQSQWLIASSWLSSPQFHYQSWSSNLHLWWIFLIGMNCFVIISLFNKTGLNFKPWKPFISEKMRSICNHTTFFKDRQGSENLFRDYNSKTTSSVWVQFRDRKSLLWLR